ncbi:MAG: tol-pal system YbgF family protein [Phycisphaerae bacterium]
MKRFTIILAASLLAAIALAPAQTKAPPPVVAPPMTGQLTSLDNALKQGEFDKVIKDVDATLVRYNSMDLPRALWLRGRARQMQAEKTADAAAKKALLLQAGLDLMRVATFFPYSNEAGPALVETGKVLAAAGDKTAALNALDAAMSRYQGAQAADDAKIAKEALMK